MKPLTSFLLTMALTSCGISDIVAANSSSPEASKVADIGNSTPDPYDPTVSTEIRPNVWLEVATESGTCPEMVGLWELIIGFEGGADHTVVADIAAISATTVQITRAEARHITYEAPLIEDYATCQGIARSEFLSMYAVYFGQGKVRFDLDLSNDNGFRELRHADISANCPYVFWRAAE